MPPLDIMKNVQHVTSGPAFEQLGLIHHVRIPPHPPSQGCPALVMVHGFQGNEDVTWVFARTASPDWLIVTPRAPLVAPNGEGFSWNVFDERGKTVADSLWENLGKLRQFIEGLASVYPVDGSRIVMLGFSQGAAMSYALAAQQPQPPLLGLVALGGYIPGPVTLLPLHGLPILILHGTQDETIPISLARKNRDQLETAGAQVTYQEDRTGHKVSANGMRTLASWLQERLIALPPASS